MRITVHGNIQRNALGYLLLKAMKHWRPELRLSVKKLNVVSNRLELEALVTSYLSELEVD